MSAGSMFRIRKRLSTTVKVIAAPAILILLVPAAPLHAQQSRTALESPFASPEQIAAPVVLCIDDKPGAGGQPSSTAYMKAAANGFRAILTLRSKADGVDLVRERFMVERNNMRYFNISAAKTLPRREQVDEFLRLVRDPANHPMLINCAFAERVAPFMMIFRIVEQGWSKDRAIEEAARSGLKSALSRKFLDDYLAPPRNSPNL